MKDPRLELTAVDRALFRNWQNSFELTCLSRTGNSWRDLNGDVDTLLNYWREGILPADAVADYMRRYGLVDVRSGGFSTDA